MNRTPLILAIVLVFLPVLYVGSYCAMVTPEADWLVSEGVNLYRVSGYRSPSRYCAAVFWPLEQIDRKVRPGAWEPVAESTGLHRVTVGDDGLERIGVDFAP